MEIILPMCVVAYIMGIFISRSEWLEEEQEEELPKIDTNYEGMIEEWNKRRRKLGREEYKIHRGRRRG
tara:strand:+ start:306 stop:509 length:204 start_codon:yes stop_codon:yes gene_type:complete